MFSPFCKLRPLCDFESLAAKESIDTAATSSIGTSLPHTPPAARHYMKHSVNAVLRRLGQIVSF